MLLPFALLAFAQAAPPAADPTNPPAGTHLLVTAEGRGVQIYHCASLPDNQYAWQFDAPLATLYQPGTNTMLATHTGGPSWTWVDGSSVRATVSAKKPAAGAGDIPWLLLQVQPKADAIGTLAKVTWVRRFNTAGGAAPATGCDANHASEERQVPYTASYSFYSGAVAQR